MKIFSALPTVIDEKYFWSNYNRREIGRKTINIMIGNSPINSNKYAGATIIIDAAEENF